MLLTSWLRIYFTVSLSLQRPTQLLSKLNLLSFTTSNTAMITPVSFLIILLEIPRPSDQNNKEFFATVPFAGVKSPESACKQFTRQSMS